MFQTLPTLRFTVIPQPSSRLKAARACVQRQHAKNTFTPRMPAHTLLHHVTPETQDRCTLRQRYQHNTAATPLMRNTPRTQPTTQHHASCTTATAVSQSILVCVHYLGPQIIHNAIAKHQIACAFAASTQCPGGRCHFRGFSTSRVSEGSTSTPLPALQSSHLL
jgi:hypothetical protein